MRISKPGVRGQVSGVYLKAGKGPKSTQKVHQLDQQAPLCCSIPEASGKGTGARGSVTGTAPSVGPGDLLKK